jgi:hypothetical protein
MNAAISTAASRLRPRGLGAGRLRFPNLCELAPLKLGDALEGATEEDLEHVGALHELRILCPARASVLTSLAVLSSLSALSRLSFRRCRALPPAALAALPPSLRALDAGGCARLGDAALPALAAAALALSALDLAGCGLRGDGLAALAGLIVLQVLDLSSSPALADAMLAHLAGLPRLVDRRDAAPRRAHLRRRGGARRRGARVARARPRLLDLPLRRRRVGARGAAGAAARELRRVLGGR